MKTSGQSNLTKGRIAAAPHMDDSPYRLAFQRAALSPPLEIVPSHGGSGPNIIHGSLTPPKSTPQTASRSVYGFSRFCMLTIVTDT